MLMWRFRVLTPFVVVAAVLGLIWAIGSILLAAREAIGESEQAALIPVFVALALAAIITVGAFIVSAQNDRRQQG